MAIIIITHDLGVVAEIADEIAVMYAGRIVEHAPADAIFAAPEHPYTWGLLKSIPRLDTPARRGARADPRPAAEPDHPPLAAATSTRAARTCASAHKRDRPAARAGRPAMPGHQVACLLAPTAARIWRG